MNLTQLKNEIDKAVNQRSPISKSTWTSLYRSKSPLDLIFYYIKKIEEENKKMKRNV